MYSQIYFFFLPCRDNDQSDRMKNFAFVPQRLNWYFKTRRENLFSKLVRHNELTKGAVSWAKLSRKQFFVAERCKDFLSVKFNFEHKAWHTEKSNRPLRHFCFIFCR